MQLEPHLLEWEAINDGVMGGLSRSRPRIESGAVCFEGALSLENNGGFASMRAHLPQPLIGFAAARLKVSGDGRRYQFRLRENGDSRGVAWRAFFRPPREAALVELHTRDFQAVIRGEPVIGARALPQTRLHVLGFMLADRQTGPFALRLQSIELITSQATHD